MKLFTAGHASRPFKNGVPSHYYDLNYQRKMLSRTANGWEGSSSRLTCGICHARFQNCPTRTIKITTGSRCQYAVMVSNWKSQKNGNRSEGRQRKNPHGFCALGFRVIRLLYIRNGSSRKAEGKGAISQRNKGRSPLDTITTSLAFEPSA